MKIRNQVGSTAVIQAMQSILDGRGNAAVADLDIAMFNLDISSQGEDFDRFVAEQFGRPHYAELADTVGMVSSSLRSMQNGNMQEAQLFSVAVTFYKHHDPLPNLTAAQYRALEQLIAKHAGLPDYVSLWLFPSPILPDQIESEGIMSRRRLTKAAMDACVCDDRQQMARLVGGEGGTITGLVGDRETMVYFVGVLHVADGVRFRREQGAILHSHLNTVEIDEESFQKEMSQILAPSMDVLMVSRPHTYDRALNHGRHVLHSTQISLLVDVAGFLQRDSDEPTTCKIVADLVGSPGKTPKTQILFTLYTNGKSYETLCLNLPLMMFEEATSYIGSLVTLANELCSAQDIAIEFTFNVKQ